MKFLMFFLLVSFVMNAEASELAIIRENNESVRHFKQEKFLESYSGFVALLAKAPYDLLLQFNLGVTLSAVSEEEKAEKLYRVILEATESQLESADEKEMAYLLKVRFAALYNLGTLKMTQKDIPETLKYYQQALALNPESKEIKTNIELLFAGGSGKGKGKSKDKNKDKKPGDKKGDGDPQDGDDQDKDKKKEQRQSEEEKKKKEQQKKRDQEGRKFDQSQMSMDDLKKIMEELKQQEQKIRAKIQGKKGGKQKSNDKNW